MKHISQLIRHRQLRCVISADLGDLHAGVLGNHPALQCRTYRSIQRANDVVAADIVEGSWRNGYRRRKWRDRLRTVLLNRPVGNMLRTALVQSGTRGGSGHDGDGRLSFDHNVCLDLIAGSLRKLRQVEKTLAIAG